MTQVLVVYDNDSQTVDFATNELGHISLAGGLETAALYSIGSNRRARPSDGFDDSQPYGWWGDDFAEVTGDEFGSHLWVVRASGKLTVDTMRRLQLAGDAAFAWLVRDKLAKSVTFNVERADPDRLGLSVSITRPSGDNFRALWKVHENGI